MTNHTLTCIRCNCALIPVNPEDRLSRQSYDGVVCTTYGNYGSRLFDSFDGSYLVFSLCDACLYAKKSEVLCFKEGTDTYVKPASKIFPSSFEVQKSEESAVINDLPLLSRKQAVLSLTYALGRSSAYGYVRRRTKKLSLRSLNHLVVDFQTGTRDSFEKALREVDRTLVRETSRKQVIFL